MNEVLDVGFRESDSNVIGDDDLPMGSSSCVQYGACIQLCPVGLIIDKTTIRVSSSRQRRMQAPAFVTQRTGKRTVYIPYHNVAAKVLTTPVMNPIAKILEYKACAVNINKIS